MERNAILCCLRQIKLYSYPLLPCLLPPPTLATDRGTFASPPLVLARVIVNGVHFDTSGATITKDGATALQSDLRVGQVVEVQGDFSTGVAAACSSETASSDHCYGAGAR